MSDDGFRILRISTDGLVVHSQVAWIYYLEGPIEIAAKVLFNPETGRHFVSLPRLHRRGGTAVQLVRYPETDVWNHRVRALLTAFRTSEYYK